MFHSVKWIISSFIDKIKYKTMETKFVCYFHHAYFFLHNFPLGLIIQIHQVQEYFISIITDYKLLPYNLLG